VPLESDSSLKALLYVGPLLWLCALVSVPSSHCLWGSSLSIPCCIIGLLRSDLVCMRVFFCCPTSQWFALSCYRLDRRLGGCFVAVRFCGGYMADSNFSSGEYIAIMFASLWWMCFAAMGLWGSPPVDTLLSVFHGGTFPSSITLV
jgi:hypothetical protein